MANCFQGNIDTHGLSIKKINAVVNYIASLLRKEVEILFEVRTGFM